MIRVLHVIPELSRGGPTRALEVAAPASSRCGPIEHSVVGLRASDPLAVQALGERGVDVLERAALPGALEAADIVQVHFWNSPQLYELLGSELPATRLLVWPHVNGAHAPQVIPPELVRFADSVVASCEYTAELPGLGGLPVIPAVCGWERVERVERRGDPTFTVGYVGTLDFSKLHPDFVSMCAAVPVPGARFVVCGHGRAAPDIRREAAKAGLASRLELRGFVEDIGAELASMDVLGYPLSPLAFAASELAVQEAMYAGVPPIVLAGGALDRSVSHGVTGLVVNDAGEYARAIGRLHDDPGERARLGAAAHEHAARHWSPEVVGPRWAATYEELMERPKRSREPYPIGDGGARRFVHSLGGQAPEFRASLEGEGDVPAAERSIAASRAISTDVLLYRDHFPDDPHLRLWSGLSLHGEGREALAAGEIAAAARLGLPRPLVSVIVPVRNGARFLAQALESVLGQTHPPYEIVVVDGGSTDGSREIALRYDRVKLVDQVGTGFAGAWNEGVAAASCDVLAFDDSDDLWEPHKLERQLEVLRERPDVDYVVSRVRFFLEPGHPEPPGFDLALLEGDHVAHMPSALVIRRAAFDRVGPFRTDHSITNDIDWFARAKDLPLNLAVVPELLVHKRVHEANLSYTAAQSFNSELLELLRSSVGRRR